MANPDQLGVDDASVELTRRFAEAGKPIAVICHGPWSLIEADMARDRTTTSWPSLQTDLRNAGATWVDRNVVVCTSGPLAAVEKRALANAVRTGRISDDVARRLSRNIDTDLEVKPHELAAELVDDDENDKDDEDNER